jgi:hypothetical protein
LLPLALRGEGFGEGVVFITMGVDVETDPDGTEE